MGWLDSLVERRIADAMDAGAFDDLPGAGKPLVLDDDRLVAEDVRVAYRILRNAGFLPPELEQHKEAADLRALLRAAVHADDEAERRVRAKLALLDAAIEARGALSAGAAAYRGRIVRRLGGG